MAMLNFDPDRVRTLGTSFDTVAYAVVAADVDGNLDLVQSDLAGSMTASMCGTVSDLAREALNSVKAEFLAVSGTTLHAVSEFTGKDETIADGIHKVAQGVR